MTEAPPPRYRVVERGRRLEVIDTRTGDIAASHRPHTLAERSAQSASAPSWWPRQTRFDGSTTLTTLALYDGKGPRTLELDPSASRIFIGAVIALGIALLALIAFAIVMPWVALVPFALAFQPKLAGRARTAVTTWLDRFDATGPAR